ncbi:MAG TPA: DUF4038 domain-containing protein [Jiangellales bacterium]|nr:DUF4038 domain-containing protein [Jiangellales bacterium]
MEIQGIVSGAGRRGDVSRARRSPAWYGRRSIILAVATIIALGGIAAIPALRTLSAPAGCLTASPQPRPSAAQPPRLPPAPAEPRFPVAVSKDRRYLVDEVGNPFLIVGDSPWSLSTNLSVSDMDYYFADRRAKGFNTALVGLLVSAYIGGRADLSTYDGLYPFTSGTGTSSDLSTPNPAYWSRVDAMVKLAEKHGITLMLVPAETGALLPLLKHSGISKDFSYGAFLGSRYKNYRNIIWISGNDYWASNWGNDPYVTAIARGIRSTDPDHIQTVELDVDTSSVDNPNWLPLISLSAAYTYTPTYDRMLKAYEDTHRAPVFMAEANYEFENNTGGPATTDETLRRQEYWTMTSGAAGQLYGNCYTWRLPSDWKSHLDTKAVDELGYMTSLFGSLRWYDLVPDRTHALLTAGYGACPAKGDVLESTCATAAGTNDGTLATVYTPSVTGLTIDLTRLRGRVTARWYDPTTGSFTPVAGSPFANRGTRDFTPTGNNAEGKGDWVLVLQTE